ncbi:MAG: 4-alpha-glucanotransferase [Desulfobacteraceae bacterium]|nr:MAG: 4-alpha-glucanotransferase [Desulfobacteraceae bacterium]
MRVRSSGIFLPVFCLPSRFGIGDLGPEAYRFVDFLHESKQHVWQVLPINPTQSAFGHSPYHNPSAFAFNPLLISPESMVEKGLLEQKDLGGPPSFPADRVDYSSAAQYKENLFDLAYARFRQGRPDPEYTHFCTRNADWLQDFALFTALGERFNGQSWSRWPEDIRNRNPRALIDCAQELSEKISRIQFLQYIFYSQWVSLKRYCRAKGVHVFGDIPIYIPYDSADTWAHPDFFELDEARNPYVVSGVPPDYFSETGQLWGHPLYRWETHRKRRYDWWARRIEHNLDLFDYIRIDHFRGLVAYWEVPVHEKTAVNGRWMEVPVVDFFDEMQRRFACLPIVAEDLGYITADVREIMNRYQFPGMRLLVFGFAGDPVHNPNAPHNIQPNCVVYTGTHDTNTVRGWFEKETTEADRQKIFGYLGRTLPADAIAQELVRLAMMSPANLAILPLQDLLGLGAEARLNRPSTTEGNWLWRVTESQLKGLSRDRLREMTETYARG